MDSKVQHFYLSVLYSGERGFVGVKFAFGRCAPMRPASPKLRLLVTGVHRLAVASPEAQGDSVPDKKRDTSNETSLVTMYRSFMQFERQAVRIFEKSEFLVCVVIQPDRLGFHAFTVQFSHSCFDILHIKTEMAKTD